MVRTMKVGRTMTPMRPTPTFSRRSPGDDSGCVGQAEHVGLAVKTVSRLDAPRPAIPHVVDGRADGPDGHGLRWKRNERDLLAGQLGVVVRRFEDDWHPVKHLAGQLIGVGGDDRAGLQRVGRGRLPALINRQSRMATGPGCWR